jgi:putative acetyltransferase
MPELLRTNANNESFRLLVKQLDNYLEVVDGSDHPFYDQYNKLDNINHAVVYLENKIPVGCGAFKPLDDKTVEIKRMFVVPDKRGKGIGLKILRELEEWAAENNFRECILETGIKQAEAIRLYEKAGYLRIANFGPYEGVVNSVCFGKSIKGKF